MKENLEEMIQNLNSDESTNKPAAETTEIPEVAKSTVVETPAAPEGPVVPTIKLTNFYDWYEANHAAIQNVARVKAEVTNIDSKDSMIFKVQKNGKPEDEKMELVSFYSPSTRPILNLPPVYLKVFKNDTFEALHFYNDEIFIKSYGVKTGLILIFCANVDGKVVPFDKIKIKKDATEVPVLGHVGIAAEIKAKIMEAVDVESVQLLYKQAIKFNAEFTTKEKTLDWFLKKQSEVVDINNLLKIDNVLISVI